MDTRDDPGDAAVATLRERFGFDAFRPGQAAVIAQLLAGRSALAIFPTGAGKSICYQLPALMMEGVTLVISPLIALMKDQIDFLKGRGIAAERLDSSLGLDEYRRVMHDLTSGALKLLYIAPERLGSERFLQTLRRLKLSMMAIDEAHCISEWGHNFRPDYMKLAKLAKTLGVARVLGLTATATPAVAADIAAAFGMEPSDIVKTPFHRKNLTLRVTPTPAPSPGTPGEGWGEGPASGATRVPPRMPLLLSRIRSRPPGPTIVYVTLQKTAEDVAAFLARSGLAARAYHAGMDADDRNAVQDQFMASDRAIVVATIAFGMGIDKRDIRYVYHYNLPKSLENYAQEIGRAGRDGQASTCELLAAYEDRIVLENFTFGDTPTGRAVYELLCEILTAPGGDAGSPVARAEELFDVSTYDLSGHNDVRPLVVDTVLTYLELDGVIASTGPFYNEYKFQPLRPSAQMLARFDADRQGFIRAILKCGVRGKTWWKLDLSEVMSATGADRGRIVAALNFLEEQGDMKLEVAGSRQGYRMLRRDFDVKELARAMAARFAEREARDTRRLATVLAFASAQGCRTAHLLNYFGETLADGGERCGHCDVCLGESPGPLIETPARAISPREGESIRALKAERHPALATPRQMARLLCGLNSPATTRAKLKGHPAFGLLADVPFGLVLGALGK